MKSKWLHMVAFVLLVIGGINWGLVGLFDLNVVNILFGSLPFVEMLIYVLVGLSAVFLLVTHKSDCMVCSTKTKKKKK